MIREKIADNFYFNSYVDNKFKNNILTVRFVMPLDKKTASQYAVLPYLLTISNKKFDSVVKINKKLYDLYGADLWGSVEKIGGYQVLSVGISFIDNKYSLNKYYLKTKNFQEMNQDINQECFDFLISVLSFPDFLNGFFKDENVEIAKNILINRIKNKLNNKSLYAIDRCKELMFEDSDVPNLSVDKFGTEEDIKSLTKEKITAAYYAMLNESKIDVTYVGNQCDLTALKKCFQDALKNNLKNNLKIKEQDLESDLNFNTALIKKEVLTFEEKIDISQCNLVLGFKLLPFERTQQNIHAFSVMNLLFGATPVSKLFVNVREKMSLCYNCVSRYDKFSNSIVVFMGLEAENMAKAVEEVMNQLKEIKAGNFSDEEVQNTKAAISNAFLRSKDSLSEIDEWFFKQNMLGFSNDIDQEINLIEKISAEQIIQAAKSVKLDTIYSLRGDC